jgi:hypothetical protein
LDYDIFKESGGTIAGVCEDCQNRLESDRCAVCGRSVPDDNDNSIGPYGVPDEHLPLCNSCRQDIVFGDGGEFR